MGTIKARFGAIALTTALLAGGSLLAGSTASAAPPAIPPGSTVTCSQISGFFRMRPGIGATSTSSGVKWRLAAVANNCTATAASGAVLPGVISGAIVKGDGYFIGPNTCTNAAAAANYGASTMKVQWISTPAFAPTTYSAVATGGFNAATTTDLTGLTHDRNNAGPTPVSLQLGADWTAATAAQIATDCSGTPPNQRIAAFQTPGTSSSHVPVFVAQI